MNGVGKHKSSRVATYMDFIQAMDPAQQALIKGTIVVEELLGELITEQFKVRDVLQVVSISFGSRIKLAVALGVLPRESAKAYITLYEARSRHAHTIHDALSPEDLFKIGRSLSTDQAKRGTLGLSFESHRDDPDVSAEFLAREFISHLYSELLGLLEKHAPDAYEQHLEELLKPHPADDDCEEF